MDFRIQNSVRKQYVALISANIPKALIQITYTFAKFADEVKINKQNVDTYELKYPYDVMTGSQKNNKKPMCQPIVNEVNGLAQRLQRDFGLMLGLTVVAFALFA
ncbi:MAG: hypothetical protein EZS28_030208 [Streblomastix strix]|uniref:Uncharacterized protein n=1 Tax=Streblomastix strix TaxID=222440 RepID=A0A5J4UUE8_9EUKA|nr:MAG: hypothetical protein EZS28_030208 [Streblomastix strix]